MNWQETKEKYPKAWMKADNYFGCSRMGDIYGDRHPNVRDLYDFFDEQGIWIMITPPASLDEGVNYFDCTISYLDGFWGNDGREYKTRLEAEQAAFNKAFEILENRLK